MRDLITDRTQANVDLCKALAEKGWDNLTPEEQTEWYASASKGAYNYADLNRVETAVSALSEHFGLGLVVKTDWGMWDVPTQADMTRYLANIEAIRAKCFASMNLPAVPVTMGGLTYETANNLEKILDAAFSIADATPASGEIFSGEV